MFRNILFSICDVCFHHRIRQGKPGLLTIFNQPWAENWLDLCFASNMFESSRLRVCAYHCIKSESRNVVAIKRPWPWNGSSTNYLVSLRMLFGKDQLVYVAVPVSYWLGSEIIQSQRTTSEHLGLGKDLSRPNFCSIGDGAIITWQYRESGFSLSNYLSFTNLEYCNTGIKMCIMIMQFITPQRRIVAEQYWTQIAQQ